jgi:deazaflavin-dependent oxidoreductase (nitroreductase family)
MASLMEKVAYQFMRVHDTVYQQTNGWIGHRLMGLPSLLLHTVGAKTGTPRTTSLTYARDGDDYLIVASNGGAPRSPGWYHNLKADPNIEINVGPKRFAVTAEPVLPGDPERDRLWSIVTKYNKAYDQYQKRTKRPIPIVRLTPKA